MISEYGREKRARRQSLLGQTTRRSLAVCMNADGGWGFGDLGTWVSGYLAIGVFGKTEDRRVVDDSRRQHHHHRRTDRHSVGC